MFCILSAISSVSSAVEPPAPQVMSQKVGPYPAILSCRSNRFSTPCRPRPAEPPSAGAAGCVQRCSLGPASCLERGCNQRAHLISARRKELKGKEGPALLRGSLHFVHHLHLCSNGWLRRVPRCLHRSAWPWSLLAETQGCGRMARLPPSNLAALLAVQSAVQAAEHMTGLRRSYGHQRLCGPGSLTSCAAALPCPAFLTPAELWSRAARLE